MDEILCEVEALKAIYEDDIVVQEGTGVVTITKKIRPTDVEDISSASVLATFSLQEGYPSCPPAITIATPRGISEEAFCSLQQNVKTRIHEFDGMPIVFDVIQLCEDFLLKHQHSDAQLCPICLCDLAGVAVSCTPCDHYVHSVCLQSHREHSQQQLGAVLKKTPFDMRKDVDTTLLCPVCRMIIEKNIEPIDANDVKKKSITHIQEMDDFDFNWESWRSQLANLQLLMDKQRKQGGIIDLEEERKRNLITEDTVITLNFENSQPIHETGTEDGRNDNKSSAATKGMNYKRRPRGQRYHHRPKDHPGVEQRHSESTSSGQGKGKSHGHHPPHGDSSTRGRGLAKYPRKPQTSCISSDVVNN